MKIFKYPLAILVAGWVTAYLCAPITTASNLLWLSSMGMPVDLPLIAEVTAKDIYRLGNILAILIFGGFIVAFIVAAILQIWVRTSNYLAYFLAGATALGAIMLLLPAATFEIQLIAGNRTLLGTALHMLAGGIGGLVFVRLTEGVRTGSFAIRTLGFAPFLLMSWSSFNWVLDPAATAVGFGFDFATLSDDAVNTLIRDMTAFFLANATFLLLGMLSLNYRWFLSCSLVFLFAAGFNYIAIHAHGVSAAFIPDTELNPALVFEAVLCIWALLLGLGALQIDRSRRRALQQDRQPF